MRLDMDRQTRIHIIRKHKPLSIRYGHNEEPQRILSASSTPQDSLMRLINPKSATPQALSSTCWTFILLPPFANVPVHPTTFDPNKHLIEPKTPQHLLFPDLPLQHIIINNNFPVEHAIQSIFKTKPQMIMFNKEFGLLK